jgi:hypothetical protein
MKREDEIKKQAEIYTDNRDNYVEWSDGWEAHNDIKFVEKAFIEGAKWADANPKSSWISVNDDLPCNHKELLENEHYTKAVLVVLSWNEHPSKRHISMYSMSNKIGSFDVDWYWYNTTDYTVTHWMPMPKLPNE